MESLQDIQVDQHHCTPYSRAHARNIVLDCKFDFIDDRAQTALEELKVPYKYFNVKPDERIIWQTKEKLLFETLLAQISLEL